MADREKVIKALACCVFPVSKGFLYQSHIADEGCEVDECPYRGDCDQMLLDAMELLKEQELHELTKNEWEQWKNNPRRDPICMLWYKDTTPMWILTPVEVHEPAYLMGKIKLFNRKPTTEEIHGVKWND